MTPNRQGEQRQKRLSNAVRVAFVVPTHWAYRMGGSQYQVQLLEDVMAARGDAETAFFAARIPPPELLPDRRIISSGWARSLRRYGHFWDYFSLQRRLEEFRPDVIYQRVRCSHTGIAARYAKRRNIPLIWHVSSDRDCQEKSSLGQLLRYPYRYIETTISKYGMNAADFVVTQTSTQAEMLRTNFSIEVHKVIPNFQPSPQRTDKKGDAFTVLWIATKGAVLRNLDEKLFYMRYENELIGRRKFEQKYNLKLKRKYFHGARYILSILPNLFVMIMPVFVIRFLLRLKLKRELLSKPD